MTKELNLSEEMGVSNDRAIELIEEWLLPNPVVRYPSPSALLIAIAKGNLTLNEKLLLVLFGARLTAGFTR